MTDPDAPRPFDLIETMAFDPVAGLALLERHLARLKASAAALERSFDRHGARNELQAATFRLRAPAMVRLALGRSGAVAIEVAPLPPRPEAPLQVAIVPLPIAPDDPRLAHRTSDPLFEERRRAAGADALLFIDRDGLVVDGTPLTPFVERDGRLLTPPTATGVLREELLATGKAVAQPLRQDDLEGGFVLGSAVTGLVPAVAKRG